MSRLQQELQRLALHAEPSSASEAPVRALLLEVVGANGWEVLAPLWQGVQADLQLPAPAIAINGLDGYQLWFPLAQPVSSAEAARFLKGLCERYLGDVPRSRLRQHPGGTEPVAPPPPGERRPGRWAAFVTPDLASMFAEETWLDLPPGAEAQAELLSRLQCATPAQWDAALALLSVAPPAAESGSAPAASATSPQRHDDPRGFLLQVMNDPAVPLPLRIEAAKALLPAAGGLQRG